MASLSPTRCHLRAKESGTEGDAAATDTTKLINRWPARRIDELMPWAYAAPATL